ICGNGSLRSQRGRRVTKGEEQRRSREQRPDRFAETTPPLTPTSDYTYVLDAVMRMQHGIGTLNEAVSGLKERQAEHGHKLDVIGKQIYAAIVLITVIGAILMFFAKSINDVITNRLFPPPTVQQIVLPTPAPTPSKEH